MGFVSAAAVSGLGIAWLIHVGRTQPQRFLSAFAVGFLFKLAVALMGGLAFRYIEPAAARVDHRSFLLAFASVAVLLLFVGAGEASRTLRASSTARGARSAAPRSDDERSPSPAGALTPLPTTGLAANEGTRP